METIYGIQADTETLREAHEHQKRMQQRLQEQQSAVSDSMSAFSPSMNKVKGPPKPTLSARSASSSALPSPTALGALSTASTCANSTVTTSGALPRLAGSTVTSPFLPGVDFHHQHPPGSAQLRSTTQSPAFLSKFYDVEHRLPSNIPWLALPGAAGASGFGRAESPGVFGRRRSDVGVTSTTSGTSTPGLGYGKNSSASMLDMPQQQENPQPHPQLQPQHHYHPQQQPQQLPQLPPSHHHHLLSHQDLAALSRNNSPMPLNEALPSYLRKTGVDPLHSMERSFSNPVGSCHTAPVSPFILPMHSPALTGCNSVTGTPATSHMTYTSPSHLLFAFPGTTTPQHSGNSTPSS